MALRRNRERRSGEVSHHGWRPAFARNLSTVPLGVINGSGVRRLVVLGLLLWLLPSSAAPAARRIPVALVASTSSSGANAAGRLVIPVANPLQLAVGERSLWVTTPRALIRVDPVSGRVVARIALPAIAGAVAVAGNQVWVATNPIITSPNVARQGRLFSIDARTNRIVGKPIRLRLPTGIAVAGGRLWISNGQHARFGRVTYIDPRTRRVLGSLSARGAPESIVAAAGSVWVGESDSGRVVRINPRTATIVGHPTETNGGLLTLAPARNAIWVADDYHGRLLAIDPGTARISRRRPAPGIFRISAAGANLWALFARRREVVRLNPRTGVSSAVPIRFGQQPDGLLATGTGVWAATHSNVLWLSARRSVRIAVQPAKIRLAVHPAKFTYVPAGWKTSDQNFGLLSRRGADVESYALSWGYKPNPLGWANRMPPNAIAVHVILIRRSPTNPAANLCGQMPHLPGFPLIRHFPLVLPKMTAATQEGEPDIPEYRVFGRFDNLYDIDLRVDINRLHATPAMLELAQRVVSGLRFPRWPLVRDC